VVADCLVFDVDDEFVLNLVDKDDGSNSNQNGQTNPDKPGSNQNGQDKPNGSNLSTWIILI
jgi:hypothetical protein